MELLERIKSEVDIRKVAEDLGFKMEGRRMVCPFHEEDTPSLVFYPFPQNRFHCYGCGKRGDVVNLYAEICGLDFKTALLRLGYAYIPGFGVPIENPKKVSIQKQIIKKKPANAPFEFKEIYSTIYEDFRDYCLNQTPTQSTKDAAEYLRKRGIDDWTIKHFRIFVIKNYAQVNDYLKTKYIFKDLQDCGLVNDKGNLIFFVHPIVFPFYENNRITYLQARTIGNPPENTSKYQFLANVPRRIFNLDSLRNLKLNSLVYLTEGAIDCMTLNKIGKNAISLGSANMFQKSWSKSLKRYRIVVWFDNDEAGIKGTKDIIEKLEMAGIWVQEKEQLPDFKDINEYFINRGL
jgi:DNA primase